MSERVPSKAAKVQAMVPANAGVLQRACACGQHTSAGGECEGCKEKRRDLQRPSRFLQGGEDKGEGMYGSPGSAQVSGMSSDLMTNFGHDFSGVRTQSAAAEHIQTRLLVNQPGDVYEQEAEQVAEQVLKMPEPGPQRQGLAEREIGKGYSPTGSLVQQQVGSGAGLDSGSVDISHDILGSTNQPLDGTVRAYLEPRFGHDFSQVRVHRDTTAVTLNQRLNARAFTVGKEIYFGQGQYNLGSSSGMKLLAHELTHTIQQGASAEMVQADFAVEPTTPGRPAPTLTAQQVQDAIAYNQARHTDVAEVELLRDILGISHTPAVIDEDFVNAVARYQAQFGLPPDGRLGHDTADRLAREIIASADYLGPDRLGKLAPEFNLVTSIRTLITANNRAYDDYKAAIQAATMVQQHVALLDQQLLRDIRGQLSWNNWARCVEMLGRQTPTGNELLGDRTVRGTMGAAWTASTPGITRWDTPSPGSPLAATCNPVPGTPAPAAHEEGGWVYLNLLTGDLSTRRAAAGGQAGINVNVGAPTVADSVMVATFHTHPNVGACWGAVTPSGADTRNANDRGVPNLIRGAFPTVADTRSLFTGPNRRLHLAGSRLAPGPAGGIAPQARATGEHDDE